MTGRAAEVLLAVGALLLALALVSCANPRPALVAPTCVVTEPPPGPGADEFDITDEELAALMAWSRDVWLRCAPMDADAYPLQPIFDEAGPGEESDD